MAVLVKNTSPFKYCFGFTWVYKSENFLVDVYEIGYILSIKYVAIGINFNDKQDTKMFIHTLRRRNKVQIYQSINIFLILFFMKQSP